MTNPEAQAAFATHVTTLAASLDKISYYQLLGVAQDAPADEVKRAYHRVAGIYHPDAHRSADEQVRNCLHMIFKRMSEAYRNLHDYNRRKKYDEQLEDGGAQRLVATKREKLGPTSPDAKLKTPAGKRCFMQALQQIKRKDYQGAKLNLQLALTYEGQGSKAVKSKLEELKELMKS